MPTVLEIGGYRFFFFSNEGSPLEPPHVHVEAAEKTAKFWLNPVSLAGSKRIKSAELRDLLSIVEQYRDKFLGAWNDHFSP